MEMRSTSPKFTRRRTLLILAGVVIALSLAALVWWLLGPIFYPAGGSIENQKANALPRIEKALHATFPTYCSGANSQIKIDSGFIQTGVVEQWTVRCIPDPTPWNEPFVDIDIQACRIQRPLGASLEWSQIYYWALDKKGSLPNLVGCS